MKKGLLLLVVISILAIGSSFGQGILSPINSRIHHELAIKSLNSKSFALAPIDSSAFVWGLSVSTSAKGYSISKNSTASDFNFFGAGISNTKYTLVKGKATAVWNISGQIITAYAQDQQKVPGGLGVLVSVGLSPAYLLNVPGLPVFFTIGVSYLGTQGLSNGSFWICPGINLSF
jgi:hypothetical protein